MFHRSSTGTGLAVLAVALGLGAVACGSRSAAPGGMSQHSTSPTMPGMDMSGSGNGLATTSQGYTLDSSISTLAPGAAQDYSFRIMGPGGRPQTSFTLDQTKLMHFYAIRQDLAGYQHVHPAMAGDGTWSIGLPLTDPGPYRVYASFIAHDAAGRDHSVVLSRQLTVPGAYQAAPLPPPSSSSAVDGYALSLTGQLMSGMSAPFSVRVTRAGQAVTDLEPYLDTYAHLTAFRSPDLAFAHLHPAGSAAIGAHGGPDLTFQAELPAAGDYRLFLQFQTQGRLHTAALTLHVG
jgi:hypothetical protein